MSSRYSFIRDSAAASIAALSVPTIVHAAEAQATLNVGAIPSDGAALANYAQELGLFKKAGLDVTIQEFAGGPQNAGALAAGAIDIGLTNATTLAAGYLRGINFKFIAPSSIATDQTRTDQMVVAKDSPVQKASDLNGKTIAIAGLKSLQQVIACAWVDKHGGDSKTLQFIELPFPQMAAAVVQRRADAVMLTEPFIAAAKDTTRGLGDVLDGVASTYMITGYFASTTWLAANARTATRFASAIRDTAIWANSHHKESGNILVRLAKFDPVVAATMARAIYGVTLNPALIQPVIDGSAKYGITDKSFPAAELIWQPPT